MSAEDRTLLDAFEAIFGPTDWDRPRTYDPASDLDEETLRRSFGSLSRSARRVQRRPLMPRDNEPWMDELSRCTEGGLRDVG